MKLGFVSAMLDGWSFEEAAAVAADNGFSCIEAACWPSGRAERQHAGASHINVDGLTDEGASAINEICREKGIFISALAFYPNVMDPEAGKRSRAVSHLKKVIGASAMLGVNMVTTFVGRDQRRGVEENIDLFRDVWPPIIESAEKQGVRIAIGNSPMLFDEEQWPGGQNLFASPKIWRRLFDIVPNRNFGINYDPGHFVWQMMDYLAPLYEFRHRVFHVHFKDIRLYRDRLRDVGVMAHPLEFMAPKLPGQGDVDWGAFISTLNDIGYEGPACIEADDRAFEGSRESVLDSLRLSKRYLDQFLI